MKATIKETTTTPPPRFVDIIDIPYEDAQWLINLLNYDGSPSDSPSQRIWDALAHAGMTVTGRTNRNTK